MDEQFKALVVDSDGEVTEHAVKTVAIDQLHEGDTLVEIHYSSLNYKDMLALQHCGGVIREYPMIPGIDAVGKIIESTHSKAKVGEWVFLASTPAGNTHTGGIAEYLRVPYEWFLSVPENLSPKETMILGTAGLTAAYCVWALEKHGMHVQDQPEILVTGASGGVGSIALSILKKIGYTQVTAMIRKNSQETLVRQLGAKEVVSPEELAGDRPLNHRKYHYVIDCVGGEVASHAMRYIYEYGSMAMCGNAGGIAFNTTVLPMILRGVNLLGIHTGDLSNDFRQMLWKRLATDWRVVGHVYYDEVTLDKIDEPVTQLKEGQHLGRTLVKIR